MAARRGRVDEDPGAQRQRDRVLDRRDQDLDRRGTALLSFRRVHEPVEWQIGNRTLSDADHTLVMGVLNVTPDSFSDGGLFFDVDAAIARGLELAAAGADVVDVGGESTRPGAARVPAEVEIDRVLPVVTALAKADIAVSIDTSKAEVASVAVDAGAAIVNDVTALGDPDMADLVARTGSGVVLMHMQGEPRTMQVDPQYKDVVADVAGFLGAASAKAVAAGIDPVSICLDPGIGFGKGLAHNLDLLANGVARLRETGRPVLVGASRKSFISEILGPLEPGERDPASVAAHVLAIAAGASIIRSHSVVMALRGARVADAIVRQ
ncbi:MAG: dihydropteroate synthase [Acidimicrobiia bacterium]